MQNEIIFAGFGGQGVLFGGMLLAQAAVEQGLQTTWFPNYGAEMRGGTANSTVIIADHEIGSPIAGRPTVLITLNDLSLRRFLPRIVDGGTVILNSSLITDEFATRELKAAGRTFNVIRVPATEIASAELGTVQTANVIMAGVFLKASGLLTQASATAACAAVLADKPRLIDINKKALARGFSFEERSAS